jgi:hypothetical protein
MRVVCAWCLEEGKPAFVREKEPLDDPDETHGVYLAHKDRLNDAEPRNLPRPDESGSA